MRGDVCFIPSRETDLVSSIEALAQAGENDTAALASRYRFLFGHTARGEITPYETEYGNEALFQQPQELGDLMGFYRAFGLDMRAGTHERPDHISCEFEFLMFLALKEAYALEHNDRDMRQETSKAEMLFMRDHLGRFLPAFVGQLQREDRSGFYGNLGELCRRFVSAEADRLQVPLGAANLGVAAGGRRQRPYGLRQRCGMRRHARRRYAGRSRIGMSEGLSVKLRSEASRRSGVLLSGRQRYCAGARQAARSHL